MPIFNVKEVAAKTARPTTILAAIREVVLHEDEDGVTACYDIIEARLVPPGKAGSRAFDQSDAVADLLHYDRELNGTINTIVTSTGMTKRLLWDYLYKVLRQMGFKMSHGRLVGLLEDKSKQSVETEDDQGQPDID